MGDIIRGQNLPEGLIIDIGRVDPDDLPRIVSVNGRSYVPSDVVFRFPPPVAIDPDPRWTQTVKAIVVLQDGASLGEQELIDHCRARIASYKKPRAVEFVDALPKAEANGRIDYASLDARYGGGGYPGGATPLI